MSADATTNPADAGAPSTLVFAKRVSMTGLIASSQSAYSVAVRDDELLVGTPNFDSDGAFRGAVGVFQNTGADWVERSPLIGDGLSNGAHFGNLIAYADDVLLVAADNQEVGVSFAVGAVLVFERVGAVWEQRALLTPANVVPFGTWGRGADISSARVVGGRPGTIDVFNRVGPIWSQDTPIPVDSQFGFVLATEGDTIALGGDDVVGVIELMEGEWTETLPRLSGSQTVDGSGFGATVFLREGILVVGAPEENGRGAVYVFESIDGSWTETARLSPSSLVAGDRFGTVVAYRGGLLVVGAPGTASERGAAYVFERLGDEWHAHEALVAVDGAADDLFGKSVATDGAAVVVGATGSQAAYVYLRL